MNYFIKKIKISIMFLLIFDFGDFRKRYTNYERVS
jgi:hypothetical protein